MCVYFSKNISKNHACIELKETPTGDLDSCLIWDLDSLNKLKINSKPVSTTTPNEKFSLNVNDTIQFAAIRFKLLKMSEAERKEQEKHRTYLVDLSVEDGDDGEEENSLTPNQNKVKSASKMASLFEIQNTLDDTFPLVENGTVNQAEHVKEGDAEHKIGKNGTNGTNGDSHLKMYIADTESEDENAELNETGDANATRHTANNKSNLNNTSGCGDFHLEMSESLINQSTVSIGELRKYSRALAFF